MEDSFGTGLLNSQLEEVPVESLTNVKIFGLLFSASWCPPCVKLSQELVAVYNEANAKDKVMEVIQISNEKTLKEFKETVTNSNRPWLFMSHNNELVGPLLEEYKVSALPVLVIINGNKVTLTDTGRKDMTELGVKAYEKWLKLFRAQKESELEEISYEQ